MLSEFGASFFSENDHCERTWERTESERDFVCAGEQRYVESHHKTQISHRVGGFFLVLSCLFHTSMFVVTCSQRVAVRWHRNSRLEKTLESLFRSGNEIRSNALRLGSREGPLVYRSS